MRRNQDEKILVIPGMATVVKLCRYLYQKLNAMIIQDVYDSFLPRYSLQKIIRLITDILILEDRLSRPKDQSEYFRWAISNHQNQLRKLKHRYKKFQYKFNDHTIDDFLEELNGRKGFIRDVVSTISSPGIRYMAEREAREIISEMEDMIRLKSIIDRLPEFDQLNEMPEVLERIFEAL